MMEEKWIRKFLANNPFLTDRMKKLEEQRRVESIIMTDLGYIVAYQHNFIQTISLDLVRLKRLISTYKNIDSENIKQKLENAFDSYKHLQKNPQIANKEETIRLIKLANQVRKALFKIISINVSQDDDFSLLHQIHHLFDEMIYYRNLKCTRYRNTFAPLPLFRISQENTSSASSPKCHGFSKLLSRSSPYIDFTYLPTKSSILQIQKSIQNDNFYDSIKSLLADLNTTSKELLFLKSEYQTSNILVQDFTLFPPFDVIRESPTFNEFNNFISYSINYVRSEITTLQKSVTDMISHVIPKLESSIDCVSYLPQIELEFDLDAKNNFYEARHRLLLFQNIIKSGEVFQDTIPKYESMKYINFDYQTFSKLNELKEKDYDALSSFLESVIDDYSGYLDSIPDESKKIDEKKFKITEKIKQWQAKKPPTLPEEMERRKTRLLNSTQQLREKISNDKVEITQLVKDTIIEFKAKIKDLEITTPLFPLNFEDMLIRNFHQKPKIEWITAKLNFHQKENEIMKKNVENLKLNNTELKKEIEEKKKIIELLKNKSKKHEEKGNKDSSTNSHKSGHGSKFVCSICKIRQRDAIISTCGHTFCSKCLIILQRKGCQNCPHCNTFFSESDVKHVVW